MNDEFHRFEQAGWSETGVVAAYEDAVARVTTQVIPPLLDAAGVGRGTRLLDVASGLGQTAAAARERGATVTGLDFSPAMVDRARQKFPGIDFRQGDAQALPFSDGTFDAVVSAFGMLHFADPDRALAELFRVLHPGGRVAFSVWATPDRAVAFGVAQAAAKEHGISVELPTGPAYYRFSDPAESLRSLAATGFTSGRVVEVPMVWHLASVDELWQTLVQGTVRNRALLAGQPPEARARIREAIGEGLAPYRQPDGTLAIPMPAVLASGARP